MVVGRKRKGKEGIIGSDRTWRWVRNVRPGARIVRRLSAPRMTLFAYLSKRCGIYGAKHLAVEFGS